MEDKDYFTIAEAAKIRGVHRSAIYKAIRESRLEAVADVKPGALVGRYLIPRAALEVWRPVSPQERGRRAASARHRKDESD